ncbi:high-potential iron-sulfur protein [Paraburkholderia bonniea]|uniref:high-potential iron-sulfur protein n=1 Tax=Paraburkholderia bonniea TaxID=2152891 RepID=UPI001291D4AC|nr:high-potential iron-sulfur protein [Paraburkholderia bonniea]WJF90190.1 high-potential iron-sulfur protein [Paraburkholderia bonniea]WJF93504.1 high-potential iron-sulfur protein [Paraburkholderia bonniea]
MKTSRRTFLFASLSAVSTLAVTRQALAAPAAPAKAAETDPTAVALGYVADAAKVDKKKYAKYAAGQDCGNCSFYQGKASDPWAHCPMFGSKQVASKGWCNAYNKRA